MMRSTRNWALVAVAVPTLGVALAGCGEKERPLAAVALPTAAADPRADVYDDNDKLTAGAPQADIITTVVLKSASKLELRYTALKSQDPVDDPNWESDNTYTDFMLETTGDDKADFDVEYGVSEGELYVDVYRVDDQEDPPVLCAGEPSFADNTYVATVTLECLGKPSTIGYRVETTYDQDVEKDDSLAAYDYSPEDGFLIVP